jgi:hypothetical protein
MGSNEVLGHHVLGPTSEAEHLRDRAYEGDRVY